jgi:phosphatidate cytidylyltransferase
MSSQAPSAGLRWGDLRLRVISSLVLGPIALGAIWVGGWPFRILVLAAAAVLAWEWVHLRGLVVRRWPGFVIPAVLLLAVAAMMFGATRAATGILLMAGYITAALAAPPPGQVGAGRRWLAGGVPYIGIAAMALLALREAPGAGPGDLLFVVAVVWASDIGAYLAGRLVGGPKLAPRISPTKTVAGAIGGLAASLAAGMAVAQYFAPAPVASIALAASVLGIAAQAGDLFESWIKRACSVKDSSQLIPGHGGLLDRVDGLLAATPVALILAMISRPAPLWHLAA